MAHNKYPPVMRLFYDCGERALLTFRTSSGFDVNFGKRPVNTGTLLTAGSQWE